MKTLVSLTAPFSYEFNRKLTMIKNRYLLDKLSFDVPEKFRIRVKFIEPTIEIRTPHNKLLYEVSYNNRQDFKDDIETLGFYNRTYILFGSVPTAGYYNGDGVESVPLVIQDGEVGIDDGILHVHDADKESIDELLLAADGWGGFVTLNLAEYRSLKDRIRAMENQADKS